MNTKAIIRTPLVAGNWKMHGSFSHVRDLLHVLTQSPLSSVEMAVFPSFVFLPEAKALLSNTEIAWGAQNVYCESEGAYTGEISPGMLSECGCRYVLIGHSERRALFQEDDALLARKFKAAQTAGVVPMLCVGETLEQHEAGRALSIVEAQLNAVISAHGVECFAEAVIAYEPVWAIGTGKSATPDIAQAIHQGIRAFIATHSTDISKRVRILYGGSVKPDNAAALFAMPDIDGALVGGASLMAESFLEIARAAENELMRVS